MLGRGETYPTDIVYEWFMIYSLLIIAAVKSEVVADPNDGVIDLKGQIFLVNLPPMSAVLTFPSLMTPKIALAMVLAMVSTLVNCQ